jgi:hypothetical protein
MIADITTLTEGSSIHDLSVKLKLVAQDLSTWTQTKPDGDEYIENQDHAHSFSPTT